MVLLRRLGLRAERPGVQHGLPVVQHGLLGVRANRRNVRGSMRVVAQRLPSVSAHRCAVRDRDCDVWTGRVAVRDCRCAVERGRLRVRSGPLGVARHRLQVHDRLVLVRGRQRAVVSRRRIVHPNRVFIICGPREDHVARRESCSFTTVHLLAFAPANAACALTRYRTTHSPCRCA